MGNNFALMALLPFWLLVEGRRNCRKTQHFVMAAVILTFLFFILRHFLNHLTHTHSPTTQVSATNPRSFIQPSSDDNDVTIPGLYRPSDSPERYLRFLQYPKCLRVWDVKSVKDIKFRHEKEMGDEMKDQAIVRVSHIDFGRRAIRAMEDDHEAQRKDIVAYMRAKHERKEGSELNGLSKSTKQQIRTGQCDPTFPPCKKYLEMVQTHKEEMVRATAERDDPDKLDNRLKFELDQEIRTWNDDLSDLNKDAEAKRLGFEKIHREELECPTQMRSPNVALVGKGDESPDAGIIDFPETKSTAVQGKRSA